MKRTTLIKALSAALAAVFLLMTVLSGCGKSDVKPEPLEPDEETEPADKPNDPEPAKPDEPAEPDEPAKPDEPAEPDEPSEPDEPAEPDTPVGRQDGERFEDVIVIEGMEETVKYEHVKNEAAGFEMDFEYETFTRKSSADGERFVSIYDDPDDPWDYLEVTRKTENADTVAASIADRLSNDYDIVKDSRTLDHAGECTHIDASAASDGSGTPEFLQSVYIIPSGDGCIVAAAHYSFEAADGFGTRFSKMVNSISLIERKGAAALTDDAALSAIKNYCFANNPDLESIVDKGEYPVYWEIVSGDGKETVVLFRSYTGAQIRYHIDPVSGETYVTETAPDSSENRTDETFNVRDYLD